MKISGRKLMSLSSFWVTCLRADKGKLGKASTVLVFSMPLVQIISITKHPALGWHFLNPFTKKTNKNMHVSK
jgi:hypothetical protein